jgi:hypothetical protein
MLPKRFNISAGSCADFDSENYLIRWLANMRSCMSATSNVRATQRVNSQ